MAPIRPAISAFSPGPFAPIPFGPTAVQVVEDCALVGSKVKIRKPTVARSATASPRPGLEIGLTRLSDQLLMVPVRPATRSVISRVQAPPEVWLRKAERGNLGLNRPKNGGPPFWMGVVAVSSNV